ncbi:DNA methyltransferase [Herbiconiux daphne]|uniref:DNA methylase N-4/N-6 domain-containing protein n=1 Tax=Herbiconiux daphne TaxID=2970914 RepID=A0ABT2HAE2_9MICO|nr:DNA methyltransferase [Herbiconiux daphne]MCS5736862.1 hypothetical protein [Herbiconiux daphne]
MENFRLFNEDTINGMKGLISQNIKVDCIITDPPYKLTSKGSTGTMGGEFWTSERSKKGILFDTPDITDWINLCYDLLNEGTHIYIMTNDKNLTHYLDTIKKSKFEFVKTII